MLLLDDYNITFIISVHTTQMFASLSSQWNLIVKHKNAVTCPPIYVTINVLFDLLVFPNYQQMEVLLLHTRFSASLRKPSQNVPYKYK